MITPLQSASTADRGKGALARRQITQFVIRSVMKGVQDEIAPSLLVLLPFIKGHDPFEQMAVTAAAEEHFRRRQGRGGASMAILPSSLLWYGFVKMAGQGAKAKLFCNVVTNSGC